MPFYGGPGLEIEYTYVAVKPFKAEHPIGSGTLVMYNPGETFPGEDWGMAAHNLVEIGKAVRLAKNVGEMGGTVVPPPSPPAPTPDDLIDRATSNEMALESFMGEWPVQGGGGWWTLSDGSRVRGETAAKQAQRLLDEEG